MKRHRNSAVPKQLLAIIAIAIFGLAGCATLPTDVDRPASVALTDTDATLLGRSTAERAAAHPGKSGFLLLGNGRDAFVGRAALAVAAERSIDVQYYLYHDDLTGRLLTHFLLAAADRGVRVRLLVDDMDLAGRDLGAAILDSHPNMEVRIFNPFSRNVARAPQFLTRLGSVTRRMHNKSFTVDNQAAILGGRNIGNEYFEADPDLAFSDLDVLAIGPVVSEVSNAFDRYWNSELAYPAIALKGRPPTADEIEEKISAFQAYIAEQQDSVYLQALQDSDLADALRQDRIRFYWGDGEVVYDQPEKILHSFDKTEYHLGPKLSPYFETVRQELIIFSPYFVPGKEGTAFLANLGEKGVRVRILTNSLASNDVGIVHAGYAKYRKRLLRAGVELYELNKTLGRTERKVKKGQEGSAKASLHAKSFVFDRRRVFIGSLNLDPRAVVHNTEIGVLFEQTDIAEGMAEWFDRNIDTVAFRLELMKTESGSDRLLWHGQADGEKKIFDVDPYTGFWRRLGIGFLGLLPIESQL